MTRRVLETVTRVAEPHEDCRTKEQMTEICCEDAPAVPCCEKVELWTGYTDDEIKEKLGLNLDDHGRDDQGRYVEIRRLPRSQPCGEKVTRYDVTPNSCCDGVTPIAVDTEESAEVIADNSSGMIFITGGVAPFHVSVRGNGFHLNPDNYIRDGYVDGNIFRVYTLDACGPCIVTITDGCSTADYTLRSVNGSWQEVQGADPCEYAEMSSCGNATPGAGNECISGKWRAIEYWYSAAFGCTYEWLGRPCTEAEIAATVADICDGDFIESCLFSGPEGYTACGSANRFYQFDGDIRVLSSRAGDSELWQWVC